jgi:hypothetical protein
MTTRTPVLVGRPSPGRPDDGEDGEDGDPDRTLTTERLGGTDPVEVAEPAAASSWQYRATDPGTPPVFVDSTGRHRRRARRVAWAVAAICVIYLALFGAGLAGRPVSPSLPSGVLVDAPSATASAPPTSTAPVTLLPLPGTTGPRKTTGRATATTRRSATTTRPTTRAVPPAPSPTPTATGRSTATVGTTTTGASTTPSTSTRTTTTTRPEETSNPPTGSGQDTPDQPDTDQPDTAQSGIDQSGTDQSGTDQSGTEQSGTEQSSTEQSDTDASGNTPSVDSSR